MPIDRKKTCSHAKCTAIVIELRFFMKKMKNKESVKIFTCTS